jgi:PAS domain S-box-containing protein
VGLVILTGFSVAALSYKSIYETVETQAVNHFRKQSQFFQQEIDHMLFERFSDVNSIASDSIFCREGVSSHQITNSLVKFRNVSKVFLNISFFDMNSIRVADSYSVGMGKKLDIKLLNGIHWESILNHNRLHWVGFSSSTKKKAIFFSSLVKCAEDAKPQGVVMALVSLARLHHIFTNSLHEINESQHVKIDLLDADSRLLYSNYQNLSKILQLHDETDHSDEFSIQSRSKGYLNFTGNDWLLRLHISKDIALNPARDLRDRIVLITLIGIGIAVLLSFFFARIFSRPIQELVTTTKEIASGKLSDHATKLIKDKMGRRDQDSSKNEIATLSLAFEQMVIDLHKQNLSQELTSAKLQNISSRLILATESGGIGVWVWDANTNALEWDERMHELYGVPSETKLTFKTWSDAVHPDDLHETEMRIQKALQGEGDFNSEFRILLSNGSVRNIKAAALVERDETTGEPTKMVGVNWDITDQKQSEQSLIIAKEEAEAANQAKSEFLAVMSHEIRTPLNAILGMTEVAMERNHNPDLSTSLEVIDRSGNNLLSLISDILDLSHIESGRLTLEHKPVHLQKLTQEALEIHTINAKQKLLDLTCLIEPEIPDLFNGDQKRIRQVLLNLIGNAVKFTDQGTVKILVTQPSSENLQFSVSDSGIGIPKDKQQLIFESFSQADSSNTRQHGGVGLGLAICRRLVDAMDGKIWVESETGKGSIFHFSIPFSTIIEEESNHRFPSSDTIPNNTTKDSLPKKPVTNNILLAEDVHGNVMMIEAFLEGSPYKLDVVEDGDLAVEKIKSGNQYDLVLMDIQMPRMDGLEATRRIRSLEKEQGVPRTPILALTAHAMPEDYRKSHEAGCDNHITKPISKKKLLQVIIEFTT